MNNLPLRLSLFLPFLFLLLSCGSDDDGIPTPLVTRDDYLGSYSVTETCDGGTDAYASTITAGAGPNDISINNLYNVNSVIEATVSGDRLTIAAQQDGSRTFSGGGTINGETITIEFDLSGFAGADDCRAVYARQ